MKKKCKKNDISNKLKFFEKEVPIIAVCLLFLVCKWQTYSWYMFAMKLNFIFYENSKFMNTKWWGYLVNFYYFFWNLFFLQILELLCFVVCVLKQHIESSLHVVGEHEGLPILRQVDYIYTLLYIVYTYSIYYIYI